MRDVINIALYRDYFPIFILYFFWQKIFPYIVLFFLHWADIYYLVLFMVFASLSHYFLHWWDKTQIYWYYLAIEISLREDIDILFRDASCERHFFLLLSFSSSSDACHTCLWCRFRFINFSLIYSFLHYIWYQHISILYAFFFITLDWCWLLTCRHWHYYVIFHLDYLAFFYFIFTFIASTSPFNREKISPRCPIRFQSLMRAEVYIFQIFCHKAYADIYIIFH